MTSADGKPKQTVERATKVAIVGSGPAGFYAADWLFREAAQRFEIDMFDRLPAPFGLVRFGVAPDHQRIKRAAAAFERTAAHDGFRFLGNVMVGRDITHEELREHYDMVLYATGSETDRRLGIPGEDLQGSAAATAFVGWYNGHPDYRECTFDLGAERAVIVGMGNVALDVARVLVRSPDELAETDIAGYALDALRHSRIREVVLLGRRGPAQAAFDQHELKDIVELPGVHVEFEHCVLPEGPALEALDHGARDNIHYLEAIRGRPRDPAARLVRLQFLASPVELIGAEGRVTAVRVERNTLVTRPDGSVSARGTGQSELIETGLVLRSIGYHGIPIPGVPFSERTGTIPNRLGRVTDGDDGQPLPFVYAVGWIKRGPTGLIGTNKQDAKETAECMLHDLAELPAVAKPGGAAIDALLAARGVHVVTFPQWRVLDALELAAGKKLGKVREKFYTIESMIAALARSAAQ